MPTHTKKIARAQAAFAAQAVNTSPNCGHGLVVLLNPDTNQVRIVPMRCRKWSCPHCSTIKLQHAQAQARAGHPERHIVLTLSKDSPADQAEAVAYINRCFGRLVAAIRKEFGAFEYMRVLELHKSGRPHLHILSRGTYIPWKWLSRTWQRLSGAWMTHIHHIDRTSNAVNELTKYLAKTAVQLQGLTHKTNIITTSKHWRIDPPTKDSAYSEKGWLALWLPSSITDLTDCLDLFGVSLNAVKDQPGLFQPSTRPPPTPAEEIAARNAWPDYMPEVYYLALAVASGAAALRSYIDIEAVDKASDLDAPW